ncbi:MAG TPA: MerR family transcriptional regulator [Bryobacteraceae bacterium]|nr:MerR family transcriptional regulator [Bryobacteraceae bacterium]
MTASDPKTRYQAREFAGLAGVTVRTLHHYDRLGLLRPRRARNGYRAYGEHDLARLEQIVALKFVGMPLRRIKALLDRDGIELSGALRKQRRVLEAKRGLLDRAIEAIRQAEKAIDAGKRPDTALLTKIIEVMEMQNDSEWMLKYYDGEARTKLDERRKLWSPELQERVSRQWLELIRDVEAAVAEDPAGEKGQALAGRWIGLIEEFTGGDPGIANSVQKLYADSANWPAQAKQQMQPFRISPEVWGFINRAIEVRKQRS